MLNLLAKTTTVTQPVVQPSISLWLTIVGVIISIITISALVVYGRKYVDSQNVKAQLDAKDSIIKTNEESIESLKIRVEVLIDDLKALTKQLVENKIVIEQLQVDKKNQHEQYQELAKYSAPEATRAVLNDHKEIMASLDKAITMIEELLRKVS